MFTESWTYLPTTELQTLQELAQRLAAAFDSEAERIDVELFRPKVTT
jgi:hypothetical protein